MNNVQLLGRLINDPNVTTAKSGTTIAKYTIAVKKKFKNGDKDSDFINCICFGKTADFVGKFLKKGTMIALNGSISTGSYTNKDGNKVYTTEVLVESHFFCGGKNEQSTEQDDKPPFMNVSDSELDGFLNVPDNLSDTELPFV